MADAFLLNNSDVVAIVSNLRSDISNYDNAIVQLERLINEIESSPSWKDAEVKSSFLNVCFSYVTKYKMLKEAMESFINYLDKKSKSINELDNAFGGGS